MKCWYPISESALKSLEASKMQKRETENKIYKTVKYSTKGVESRAAGILLERECQFQSASSIDLMPRL